MSLQLKKILLLSSLFLISTFFTINHISSHNQKNFLFQESTPLKQSFKEINPRVLVELKQELTEMGVINNKGIQERLDNLTRTKTIYRHAPLNETSSMSAYPLIIAWASFALFSFFIMMRQEKTGSELSSLFKKTMDVVEYPVLMVDSALNILWQNRKSSSHNYSASKLEEVFDESLDGSEVSIDSKLYSVLVTELKLKNGQRNYLAHLVPKAQMDRHENVQNNQNVETESLI